MTAEQAGAVKWISTATAARQLGVCPNTALKILRKEKTGVHFIYTPGRAKPIVRINPIVIDRILRRSTPA